MAWRTVRSNKVRTAITVAIITFGIMALIGILTAIEAMKQKLTESFSFMGANTFSIRVKERKINLGGRKTELSRKEELQRSSIRSGQLISYEEALAFKQHFLFPATVSISPGGGRAVTVRYGSRSTNPNIPLAAGDENYLTLNGYSVAYGRNFNEGDMQTGRNICLLGADVAKKLFKDGAPGAPGSTVYIQDMACQVAGVLRPKGSASFLSFDNIVIIPLQAGSRLLDGRQGFSIAVQVKDVHLVDAAINEATGAFRSIRKLQLTDENNFTFEKSDRLARIFISASGTITFSAIAIGLITLFGAAIGLMNIMLVAVNERTREVGLIKAIGGKNKSVQRQFLYESVIISILGAVIGIILGLIIGNLVGSVLNTSFIVPWKWVIGGIVLCTISGLAAGLYPAWKASRLDPIAALRYE